MDIHDTVFSKFDKDVLFGIYVFSSALNSNDLCELTIISLLLLPLLSWLIILNVSDNF